MNSRAEAARIVYGVADKQISLDKLLKSIDDSFTRNLCYGTTRWYIRLVAISEQLLHRPLPKKHHDVLATLLVGLYQLIYLDTPHYAVISETVNATKLLTRKKWAAGLINKTLRVFLEKKEKIISIVDSKLSAKYALSNWLLQKIKKDWPDTFESILQASNSPAPMTLRVNPKQITVDKYVNLLANHKIQAKILKNVPYGIQLNEPVPVSELPGFKEGYCYLQDEASQMVTPLLELKPGMRVLDACAAPGGKTTDILSTPPPVSQLIVVEKNAERMNLVKENLTRLQLNQKNCKLIQSDILDIKHWWDGKPFDRILLDAPCSATGVIRRHPDIKLLRKPEDIEIQVNLQLNMLTTLWPLLSPNGKFVYSTCSILKVENEKVVDKFVKEHTNAQVYSQKQLLPTINGHDGFFFSVINQKP